MNPHQKPQEDVVVTQEDIDAAKRWKGVWGSFADRLPVMDLAFAFARHRLFGHEAGRRDMREAAGSFMEARAAEIRASTTNESTGAMMHAIYMAEATTIRALPTEPLGGDEP